MELQEDPNRGVAAGPIRRDHGQATGSSVLKEARSLKHSADRLKVAFILANSST